MQAPSFPKMILISILFVIQIPILLITGLWFKLLLSVDRKMYEAALQGLKNMDY